MSEDDNLSKNHAILDGKLDETRQGIIASARNADRFNLKLEIVTWFVGTAATTFGAMFYGKNELEYGIPLLVLGVPMLIVYALLP